MFVLNGRVVRGLVRVREKGFNGRPLKRLIRRGHKAQTIGKATAWP